MNIACDMDVIFHGNISQSAEECEKQIVALCESGFKSFNFSFFGNAESPLLQDDWENYFYNLRNILEKYGARLPIAHSPVAQDGDKLNDFQHEMKMRTIKGCEILGIEWLVSHPKDIEGKYDKEHLKKLKSFNYDFYSRYIEALEKNNTGIAIETMTNAIKREWKCGKRQYADNPYDLIELVDSINSDRIGICLDTGHVNTCNTIELSEVVRAFGKRLKALHVHDNNGISDEHLLPYMGNIDWKELVHALRDIDYKGDFTFEASKIPVMFPTELRVSFLKFKYELAEFIVNL